MSNNQNEGHPGATISQIQGYAANSLNERPNIVLIHAGTNDMNPSPPPEPYDGAPDRLNSLINAVIATCPDATILVAQIIHAKDAEVDARIKTFNDKIPGIASAQVAKGHKVSILIHFFITVAFDAGCETLRDATLTHDEQC